MKIQIHLAHKIGKAVTVLLLSDMVTFRNPLRSNSTVIVMYDYLAGHIWPLNNTKQNLPGTYWVSLQRRN